MGHVLQLRTPRAQSAPASPAMHCCARCGTDLWNLLADGRVRCADCEQECPLRVIERAGSEFEANDGK